MKSHLDHIQIFIDYTNIDFYKNIMAFLGWSIIFEHTGICGFRSGENGDVWVSNAIKTEQNDYDTKGVNHVSIRVEKKEDVDSAIVFLKKQNITPLFDTPRHRPEVASVVATDTDTYYQIMFEAPDKVLFEIVYIGAN